MPLRVHVYPVFRVAVTIDPVVTDRSLAVAIATQRVQNLLSNGVRLPIGDGFEAEFADDFDEVPGQTPVVDLVDENGVFLHEVPELPVQTVS